MSNFENTGERIPTSAPPRRTWDFWETALVTLIAYGVFTLAGGWAMTIIITVQDGVAGCRRLNCGISPPKGDGTAEASSSRAR
ncbi:hypothetical protein [Bradyrhizobium tropiciagri]|uniref:hypothetical protein n=1 Tax=Bradyrhizobium tropiciagri TaxID=312253 RepID=UPI000B163CA5|nr:hypothetical protein [Bradyrhizobium tropiciagri]